VTIYRNPVPGSTMKAPLGCVDLVDGGTRCRDAFAASPLGKKFLCPNLGGGCTRGAFCYPRKQRVHKKTKKVAPHFHQGIDLGADTGTRVHKVGSAHFGTRRRS